jgi:methylated-DNA-[protein]-cysteine S-methyltransferase
MKGIIQIQHYQSPCGELLLGSYEGKLCLCDWVYEERRKVIDKRIQKIVGVHYTEDSSNTIENAITQLDEYFDQKRTMFDIPLLFAGTDFQKQVWEELLKIPYGSTASYAGLSHQLGNPKAIRAVAAANGANAISIFVPCHRIIGTNHKLIGYAGGLPAKKHLLDLEASEKLLF